MAGVVQTDLQRILRVRGGSSDVKYEFGFEE